MFEIGGKQIPATLAEMVDAKRAALLLWDMENAIAPNAPTGASLTTNLMMPKKISEVRSMTCNTGAA